MLGVFRKSSWLKSSVIARLDDWKNKRWLKKIFNATLKRAKDGKLYVLDLVYIKKQTNSLITVFFEVEEEPAIYFGMQTNMPYEDRFQALVEKQDVFKHAILLNSKIPPENIITILNYNQKRDTLVGTLYLQNKPQASNKEILHLMDNVIRWHIIIQNGEI